MAKRVYGFALEGENVDGDLLTDYVEFENVESFKDACELVEDYAVEILTAEDGGHIDIFDTDDNFINSIEV